MSLLHNAWGETRLVGREGILMVRTIDDDIIQLAKQCRNGHSCLNAEDDGLCPIERVIGKKDTQVAFVRCIATAPCPYRISYGSGLRYVCSCPVRLEIYRRYGEQHRTLYASLHSTCPTPRLVDDDRKSP